MSEIDLSGEEAPEEDAGEAGKGQKKDAGAAKPRKAAGGSASSSRSRSVSETDLKKRIGDGLDEIVELIARHDPELAETIREDAGKMAEVLAARAVKHARVARLVVRLFGRDSGIAIARAFGPSVRGVVGNLRQWRDQRLEEDEAPIEPDPRLARGQPPQPPA